MTHPFDAFEYAYHARIDHGAVCDFCYVTWPSPGCKKGAALLAIENRLDMDCRNHDAKERKNGTILH